MSDQKRRERVNDSLQAFQEDSLAFMDQQPPKMNREGNIVKGARHFSDQAIRRQDYIAIRDGFRAVLIETDQTTSRAAFQANDLAQNLVDTLRFTDLDSIENAGLRDRQLAESPWSDDYWALYTGALGKRYADPLFPSDKDWKKNYDYILANPAQSIIQSNNRKAINRLSPAEKYDALIGDVEYGLTKAMWSSGHRYYQQYGEVEEWMGLCHGWAPAAFMMDRPTQSVVTRTTDGIEITFYPSDIKSLATLLWAKVMPKTRFIGGRCHTKEEDVEKDANGRVLSPAAFDTNPGTWHLSVVNQIGLSQRSMVLDVTYDYEVWNQPIQGYSYRYFNPEGMVFTETLAEAKVPVSGLSNDRFRDYRSSEARSLVGIHMELAYVVETDPSHHQPDSDERDLIQKVDYYYDLELDAAGKIIGGEWYLNKHPDFLWTPQPRARAVTRYDAHATGQWMGGKPVPKHWCKAAKQASIDDHAPMAAIVERLIQLSHQPRGGQSLA